MALPTKQGRPWRVTVTQIGREIVILESQFLDIVSDLVHECSLGLARSNQQWHYLRRKLSTR